MGYYMRPGAGDFYTRGGRGDPGFFSGLLNIGKAAAGMALSVVPGGSAVAKLAQRVGGFAGGTLAGSIGQSVKATTALAKMHPVLTAAGAAGTAVVGGALVGHAMAGPGAPMKGFHMSKPHKGVSPHMVRNRHMRATNPRALRRSLRRVAGFARIARRVLHFTHPRSARGAPRYKFPKRRKAA